MVNYQTQKPNDYSFVSYIPPSSGYSIKNTCCGAFRFRQRCSDCPGT